MGICATSAVPARLLVRDSRAARDEVSREGVKRRSDDGLHFQAAAPTCEQPATQAGAQPAAPPAAQMADEFDEEFVFQAADGQLPTSEKAGLIYAGLGCEMYKPSQHGGSFEEQPAARAGAQPAEPPTSQLPDGSDEEFVFQAADGRLPTSEQPAVQAGAQPAAPPASQQPDESDEEFVFHAADGHLLVATSEKVTAHPIAYPAVQLVVQPAVQERLQTIRQPALQSEGHRTDLNTESDVHGHANVHRCLRS